MKNFIINLIASVICMFASDSTYNNMLRCSRETEKVTSHLYNTLFRFWYDEVDHSLYMHQKELWEKFLLGDCSYSEYIIAYKKWWEVARWIQDTNIGTKGNLY